MPFISQFSEQEREAIAVAVVDRGIRPVSRVLAMAAAGELTLDDRPLPPFVVKESTARDWIRQLRRRRFADRRRSITDPRDLAAVMQAALGDELERGISKLKASRRRGDPADEKFFKTAKAAAAALREFQSLGDQRAPESAGAVRLPDGRRVGPLLAAMHAPPESDVPHRPGLHNPVVQSPDGPEAVEPELPKTLEEFSALTDTPAWREQAMARLRENASNGDGVA